MADSTMQATPLASLQTVGQARAELEARLLSIHNDLQLTQSIGLLFVKRQEDLRNCFEQLQELKDLDNANHQQQLSEGSDYGSGSESTTQQPLPEEIREHFAMLDKEFQDSQGGILGLKGLIDAQLPTIEIQPPQNDSTARSTGVLGPSALPSSALPTQTITKPRRHKVVVNSIPSINDPAFPVQIQEELLNQVRYWTSQAEMKEKLNQEYDTKITEMERIIDALNKQRRMREESDERQKEDQWNLELMNQELRSQNTELQQQLSRAVHETSKIQKALAVASEQLEHFKDKEERTAGQLELTKSRHEQDMTTMRKHTAGIQRDKSDLMKKMEELQETVAQQQQKLAKKATMEALALAQEKEEQEPQTPIEAPILIQAPPRLPINDEPEPAPAPVAPAPAVPETKVASLARETSFAHQQSIISELQSKLSQEVTTKEKLIVAKEELLAEKEELTKLLADREETIETMRMEGTMGGFDHAAIQVSDFAPASRGVGEIESTAHGVETNDEVSNGLALLRPVSPMHSGGLFAELAQASSAIEPVKPAVEYKDQEAMTEPIESWIHTIPGLVPLLTPTPTPAPPSEAAAPTASAVVVATTEKPEVETNTIATNTKTKSMVDGATSTETKTLVDSASSTDTKTLVDSASSTDAKFLADGATSTADLPVPAVAAVVEPVSPKVMVDDTTSAKDLPVPAAAVVIEPVSPKVMVDDATSTEDLPVPAAPIIESAPAKVMVDDSTSTEDLPALIVPVTEKEATVAKTLVDSTTSTDDLPVPAPLPVEAVPAQESVQPSKTLVDSTTSTDDLPVLAAIPEIKSKAPGASSRRNGHLAGIVTKRSGMDAKNLSTLDSAGVVATPTVTDLEVAHAHLPEVSTQVQQSTRVKLSNPVFSGDFGNVDFTNMATRSPVDGHKLESMEPVPRTSQSDIPLDDERRHTCDMSQTIVESSHHSAPPVPAIPRGLSLLQEESIMYAEEGQESRVSFGSAFGPAFGVSNSTAITTGRIEPVYPFDRHVSSRSQASSIYQQSEETQASVSSPGRPTTGPPSNLLARATARTSMASLLESNEDPTDVYNCNMSSISAVGAINSHPASPPISYPQRSTSIRSASIRSEKMFSSSPPTLQPRNAGSAGAAVISGTTRTAYTFSNSSSQVHIPQQPTYQQITDSSGASIGRSKHRPSPSGSVSSVSTDYGGPHNDRRMSVGSNYDGPTAADPTMIQIITQTMIGDYLWKYTRRPMASVISEKRHRRYFWVHPYTKTMYWSLNNPAADGSREQRAKSALIINVYQITDESPSGNSDLPNVSLLVQTSNRNLKLTAPTREKHELWYQSLAYLLSRPTTPGADIASDNQTWSEIQASRGVTSDALLTIKNEKAVRKKTSFNRLQTIFGRSKDNSPSNSPRSANATAIQGQHSGVSTTSLNYSSIGGVGGAPASGSYPTHIIPSQGQVGGYGTMNGGKIMSQATSSLGTSTSPKSRLPEVQGFGNEHYDDGGDDDDDGELPEHVRQCCDGKHDIGSLHHDH
ncbi:hypothetical protein BGX27_009488 [Mortierella sp. AM989]|nr:hypothetical protein BGX27_009488 [Mortierella sp. AM989]